MKGVYLLRNIEQRVAIWIWIACLPKLNDDNEEESILYFFFLFLWHNTVYGLILQKKWLKLKFVYIKYVQVFLGS